MSFYIEDGNSIRYVADTEFPLAIGGAGSPIEVSEASSSEPLAYIGVEDGEIFVQPDGDAHALTCNGAAVTTSRWLYDGDVLRIGSTYVALEIHQREARFRVHHTPLAAEPEAPRRLPAAVELGSATAPGKAIQPVDFHPQPIPLGQRQHRRVRPMAIAFWAAMVLLSGVVWFVFAARSLQIVIEPAADRLAFENGLPTIDLGDRHLLVPGEYTLVAEKEGYLPLRVPIEVTAKASQSLSFVLERLPGLLQIDTPQVAGAAIVIDGQLVGISPFEPVELTEGEHEVLVQADRYFDYSGAVVMEGGGALQTLEVPLEPAWASVELRSSPEGASVRIDGEELGVTPLTTELLEGSRRLELALAGYKTHRTGLLIEAGEDLSPEPVRLQAADGTLRVRSEPSAAMVTVDGTYSGETPVDLFLDARRNYAVEVSKAGHRPETLKASLRSGESRTLDVHLIAEEGEVEIVAHPPGAELFIDGKPYGHANQTLRLSTNPHELEIRSEGFEPHRETISPKPEFVVSVRATLKSIEQAQIESRPPRIETSQGHELVLIEGGRFRMGASRREPGRRANESLRNVEITRPYYLGTQEVSNRQFRQFEAEHLSGAVQSYNLEIDHHPAVRVSWEDAVRYCNWLSKQESLPPAYVGTGGKFVPADPPTVGYRLPTEAEWAYAARYSEGPNALKYPWGESLPVAPKSGNYADISARDVVPGALTNYDDHFPVTAPVDSFSPNRLGLYNLGGNVAEWVQDFYTIYPSSGTDLERDPQGPREGEHYVIRGSSWMDGTVTELRLSYRDYGNDGRSDVGFRIARYAE